MSIENIIRAWKNEEDNWDDTLLTCPVGQELTEEELLLVSGEGCGSVTIVCTHTCGITAA